MKITAFDLKEIEAVSFVQDIVHKEGNKYLNIKRNNMID